MQQIYRGAPMPKCDFNKVDRVLNTSLKVTAFDVDEYHEFFRM